MHLTKREQEMEIAQAHGFRAYRTNLPMPVEYKEQPHLKAAWEAGRLQASGKLNNHYY